MGSNGCTLSTILILAIGKELKIDKEEIDKEVGINEDRIKG